VYTLYNKKLDKRLTHPKVGLWYTPSLDEAKDMLKACHEYLEATHIGHLSNDFIVIEVESGEEVELS